uniref:SSD domain-containing protein n=1 Tax=Plectus sambesii TaxID=2011161 RepID=A0A914XRU2_9BILA
MLGLAIGTHPLRYLSVTLVASLLLLGGLYKIKLSDDVRAGYSKEGSRSIGERNTYCEFFNCSSPVYATTIVGTAFDGRSMIRQKHLEDFLVVVGLALNNVTTVVRGYPFALNNVTNHASLSLQVLRLFLDGVKEQNEREASGLEHNPHIILDYPFTHYYGQKIPMWNSLYGVTRTANENATGGNRLERVEYISVVFLVERGDEETFNAVKRIEVLLFDLLTPGHQSDLVKFEVLGDEVVNREVLRGARGSVFYFLIGLVLLIIFVTVTVVDWRLGFGALNRFSLLLVSTSIFSPLLAATAVFGLLSALGQPVNSMMCVMPFLLLGIGVDDAFLMIYGWRKLDGSGLTPAERLSRTLQDVGPSITITSLTNVLAFSVGAVSSSPAIRAFCICTTMALVLDFILEIALFGAVVAVTCSERHGTDFVPVKNSCTHRFLRVYCKLLVSWPVRLGTVVFLVALWSVSTMGVLKLESKFSPDKTFDTRSRLVESFAVLKQVYTDHENTLVIVNRPPRMEDEEDVALFRAAVHDMRTFSGACSSASLTSVWLEDYILFDKEVRDSVALFSPNNTDRLSYDNVPEFLETNTAYNHMVHWYLDDDGVVVVKSFSMYMCGSGSQSWADRAHQLSEYRAIVDRYPSFNMSAFLFDSTIFDMILSTASVTLQSTIVTLVSMVIICLLFIPHFGYVAVATGSIVSMILAVVGFLSWWNCDMDIITMVDILMAVGFTVDF